MVCWMADEATLTRGGDYTLKHTTRTVRAMVTDLRYRLDINTLHRDKTATALKLNEIGRVTLRTTGAAVRRRLPPQPPTGSFILIDEATNDTVAAGMIRLTNRDGAIVTTRSNGRGRAPEHRLARHDGVARDRWKRHRLEVRRCGSPGCPGRASPRSPTRSPKAAGGGPARLHARR